MEHETITVTYGEEKLFPVPYQGVTIGPYSYTTTVQPDETVEDAIKRAFKVLHKHADKMFVAKRNAFLARMETMRTNK